MAKIAVGNDRNNFLAANLMQACDLSQQTVEHFLGSASLMASWVTTCFKPLTERLEDRSSVRLSAWLARPATMYSPAWMRLQP
ncbi:MAG: hypothetical protein AAGD07_03725 [Planctomycetota bacterium]